MSTSDKIPDDVVSFPKMDVYGHLKVDTTQIVWAVVFAASDRSSPGRVHEAVIAADIAVAQLRKYRADTGEK